MNSVHDSSLNSAIGVFPLPVPKEPFSLRLQKNADLLFRFQHKTAQYGSQSYSNTA